MPSGFIGFIVIRELSTCSSVPMVQLTAKLNFCSIFICNTNEQLEHLILLLFP